MRRVRTTAPRAPPLAHADAAPPSRARERPAASITAAFTAAAIATTTAVVALTTRLAAAEFCLALHVAARKAMGLPELPDQLPPQLVPPMSAMPTAPRRPPPTSLGHILHSSPQLCVPTAPSHRLAHRRALCPALNRPAPSP